ncbi:MAG TPA: metallophosphoesterase family protein [Dehalococcoidia bacterium]|nr:metallophosphoesterase family protein [Dehalococcoidia bacterium]
MRIGVVSDTHGYVDPRLAAAFAGVEAILHAGDVGGMDVLAALQAMAPLYAVRGNNDEKLGGLGLPLRRDVALDGIPFHIVHRFPDARPPAHAGVVVFGHSHRALIERGPGAMRVNPGAAGRVGFHRIQTVALISTAAGAVAEARVVELGARLPPPPRRSASKGGAR